MLIVSCGYFGAARSVKVPQSPAGNDHFRLRAAPKIKNGGWNHLLHFSSHSYPKPLPERLATCESQSYRWPNYCISARRIASRQQIFINSPATWLRRGGVSPLRVFPRVTGIPFGGSWFDECCELYRVSASSARFSRSTLKPRPRSCPLDAGCREGRT